jgi:hypothetical protein
VISNKDSNGADGSGGVEAKPEALKPPGSQEKRPFVEPLISLPVDVLEATSFFLATSVSAAGLTP